MHKIYFNKLSRVCVCVYMCVCARVYVYVCVVFGDWKSNFSLLMGKQSAWKVLPCSDYSQMG